MKPKIKDKLNNCLNMDIFNAEEIKLLSPLVSTEGHLSSAIFSINSEIIHQETTRLEYQINKISDFILSIVKKSILAMNDAKLGKCNFIQVNSNNGILIIMWAAVDEVIIAALFENESTNGHVKLVMNNIINQFLNLPENKTLLEKSEKKPNIVGRYVSSDEHTIHKMLKLAKVQSSDILYDLGCGDARVLIYAVNEFFVEKAVGIECREDVAVLARKQILKNKLEERITIIEDDLFNIDLQNANIVFIYLSKKAGKKLSELFLNSLQKGSRIVAEAFPLRYIEPDQVYQDRYCKLYLYTIK